jgi:transposase InsO family protein
MPKRSRRRCGENRNPIGEARGSGGDAKEHYDFRASRLLAGGLSRTVLSSARKPDREAAVLRDRLTDLAATRRRFGYRRLHALLRREGVSVNHKRLYRIYREAGLSVRRRRRRRGVSALRQPLTLPTTPNQVWSMDFLWSARIEQAFEHGRKRLAFIYPALSRVNRCDPGHHGETARFRPD